ncbi:spore coat U domain-containing protein [Tsuneonella sp. YG55]|uniref:Spore coat U domain-containing protein n=1 Tax=Tsuneonella litorea TaxID=2976475 RepID=A0A9X2W0W0_9SPHN|nr:spore coat U domain-containing protein [Tsuneonella litorea]MCT2557860.1 spore coat U domain-containing protein [Tsuneonella litorea]
MGAAIGAIAIASTATPAQAQKRTTQTMPVVLTVEQACRLVTQPLDFGIPDPKAKAATSTTTITLTCTPGTVYSIGIDNGLYWDGSTRRMYGGSANGQVWYADYQLYHDALHLLPWGMGATAAAGVLGLPGKTYTVYGVTQIKNLRPAPYRDTVIVQLDF